MYLGAYIIDADQHNYDIIIVKYLNITQSRMKSTMNSLFKIIKLPQLRYTLSITKGRDLFPYFLFKKLN